MANPRFYRNKTSHFIVTLLTLVFLVYFQSIILAKIPSFWLHIDIVTIAIVYISIEHFLPLALIKILFTALLLQVGSAAPFGFYIMYFLQVIIFANLLSKIFLFSSLFGQFFIFLIVYVLKYFLFYFTVSPRDLETFIALFTISWKGFILTVLLALPIFRGLFFIDSFFEFLPAHDKKKVIDI